MSEVVKLDPAKRSRGSGHRRRRRSKTALVLGGGGFTGAVYEIGALRAFDLLAVNRTVNDFDVYVGTSAGSFVGSAVANGVTPEEMMRVLNKHLPSPLRDMDLGMLLRPNYKGFANAAVRFPFRLAGVAKDIGKTVLETSVMDVATGLAAGLPKGLYTGAGIEEYVAEMLADPDRTDDFRMLERELYLTATEIDTTERIVLGEGEWADVPISRAVAASTALPLVYEPVEIKGRDDGRRIRSTTNNIDIAVEKGQFIVVVNPIVPFVNDFSKRVPTVFGSRVRRTPDMGFVASPTRRSDDRPRPPAPRGRGVGDEVPGVDIVLIEPDFGDELMFSTSIMDYKARLQIAKHGFESVTLRLARDYDRYRAIAERHGIEISARRIEHVLNQVEREKAESPAWRRVRADDGRCCASRPPRIDLVERYRRAAGRAARYFA
ncbi:MAG: patatin-like phospholipase family protein [Solirubrobacterales bacterium]